MSEPPRSLDEQIRQAIQRGDFDNLPGKGKPLDLSENPHEDPGWRMAYRMLKESGYTLPWIETRRNIELGYEKAIKSLKQNWSWRQNATGRRGLIHAEREWQHALNKFREEITELNRRIRDYNLEIPSNQFQRRAIDAEQEIQKITIATD
jgi:DnaJ homolog subfamily C member 28